jgi:hypothetical protein
MNVEEDYLEDGYVPKKMGMDQMNLDFDMVIRTVHVTGIMPKKCSDEW